MKSINLSNYQNYLPVDEFNDPTGDSSGDDIFNSDTIKRFDIEVS